MSSLYASKDMFTDDKRLEKIDKLVAIGVGKHIALPQFVVVGDQSSGKSSTLEALTGLPFPRDSTLCTRFATHIVFNRTETENCHASIVPHLNCDSALEAKLKDFEHTFLEALTTEEFQEVLLKASDAMGLARLGQQDKQASKPTFSEHTLRIELNGPNHSHFSVVDVPGIFRNPQEGVTTNDDIALVKRIVHSYIEDERSIILAVVSANIDIANQDILKMAKEVDPKGQRTLGILTKPDLIDRGAEDDVINILMGTSNKLRLGYHAIRNRKKAENNFTIEQRNQAESEFFNKGHFSRVPPDRVGVITLRPRLERLLNDITQHEFPKVRQEINNMIDRCEQEMMELGPSRTTDGEIRSYLLRMAEQFQKYVAVAIEANYGSDPFFRMDEMRLATWIISQNEAFSEAVRTTGFTVPFLTDSQQPTEQHKDMWTELATERSRLLALVEKDHPELYTTVERTLKNKYDDIQAHDHDEDTERVGDKDGHVANDGSRPHSVEILAWIKEKYTRSRGFEMGTYNPSLLHLLFSEQTLAWEPLAKVYVCRSIINNHMFCSRLLDRLCKDELVNKALRSVIMNEQLRIYKKATGQVEFILRTERRGKLMTMNHYYSDTLERVRDERQRTRAGAIVSKAAKGERFPCEEDGSRSSWDSIEQSVRNYVAPATLRSSNKATASNIDHTVQDIHDVLKAYCKVAMKRFIDCVCMQVTDYYLISGPETPLGVLSSTFIGGLNTDELTRIAGEAQHSIQRRSELKKQIESLKEGKKILLQ
ncbi:hypothetical protein EJ05DRAFT_501088 [Pseudovirgaria hyperparasitica]|uniref:Dynamin family protein n=1 Tax=Pseudovirgaria hyperparasitica TaxID=470096 RepID=A0A6A6W7K0_9PEZI|nr:uncharacterized protein EJ05DRAFT_501088 [Pseudovirgaria hyperparasitica]KAF2757557.1 hypothetical protein EJ05DRAFT_501088 [Pseudovirgaria hyperparasitica]